jgi:hypothetical protein
VEAERSAWGAEREPHVIPWRALQTAAALWLESSVCHEASPETRDLCWAFAPLSDFFRFVVERIGDT